MPTQRNVSFLKAGDASVVAHCEGHDSNACAVHVAAGGGGGPVGGSFLQHKPANYVRFAELNLTDPASGGLKYGNATYGTNGNTNCGWGSDSTDPDSPSGVWRDQLGPLVQAGYGSGAWLGAWSSPPVYYREYYAYWTFKVVESLYYAGGIFPLTKIGFICYGNDGLDGGNSGIIGLSHPGGEQWLSACAITFAQQNNVANNRINQASGWSFEPSPNGMGGVTQAGLGAVFKMGQFNRLEHRCVANTMSYQWGPDQYGQYHWQGDGIYQQWVNGIMTHDYTNVCWAHPYPVAGLKPQNPFTTFRASCLTWGGGGTIHRSDGGAAGTANFRTGHIYLAGIPW